MQYHLEGHGGARELAGVIRSLLNKSPKGLVVAVAGNYDSDKRDTVSHIMKALKGIAVACFHHNDYSEEASGERTPEDPRNINWHRAINDIHILSDGGRVTKPKYNHQTHQIDGEETVQGRVIIIWGPFALHRDIMPYCDIKTYCESDKVIRLIRYFASELTRFRPDEIVTSLLSGHNTNKIIVEPTANDAQYIIHNDRLPSFSGNKARKLVDSLRVAGEIDMRDLLRSGKATLGETKIQVEYFLYVGDADRVIRFRKNSIAFSSHRNGVGSESAPEIWYEFRVAEPLMAQLIKLYEADCKKVSKARTIYKIVGSDFRVYTDFRTEITRGNAKKEIGHYAGIIRSRRGNRKKPEDIEPIIDLVGIRGKRQVPPYYKMK